MKKGFQGQARNLHPLRKFISLTGFLFYIYSMIIKLFEEFDEEFESDEFVNLLIKVSCAVKRIKEISYLISDEDGLDVFIIGENSNKTILKTIVILYKDENTFWPTTKENNIKRQMFYRNLKDQEFYQEFVDRIAEICNEEGVKYDIEVPTRITIYV